jgi:DNA-binding MarR family transcriptional regulator
MTARVDEGAAASTGSSVELDLVGDRLVRAAIRLSGVCERFVGRPLALRRNEYLILHAVADQPWINACRLAEVLDVAPPNMSVFLDDLQRRKLIHRESDPSDRRAKRICLTDHGQSVLDEAVRALREGERGVFGQLTEVDRAMLLSLLEQLRA